MEQSSVIRLNMLSSEHFTQRDEIYFIDSCYGIRIGQQLKSKQNIPALLN